VVDAYLHPVIDDYLKRVETPLADGPLHVMTSAGGLMRPKRYKAKDSLLSGPAGGVVGATRAGRRSGFTRIIAFDMGGTSTDVARYDGDYDYVFEHEVGDAILMAPALAVQSVASGGGSICRFDGKELRVGPESAGADPGPAAYGAGGPLTLTDVNLLLGRLDAARFDIPVDVDAATREFERLYLCAQDGEEIEREGLLDGLRDIANERMADAIRRVSIRKGYDTKEYALVAFGGAGGQHACGVAERLGIDTIVVPEDASLLSALGLGHALIERFAERQVLRRLAEAKEDVSQWIEDLSEKAVAALEGEGIARGESDIRRTIVKLRFVGQESALDIDYDKETPLDKAFESKYKTIFGYWPSDRPVEIESIRVVASARPGEFIAEKRRSIPSSPAAKRHLRAWFDGQWQSVPAFERVELTPGAKVAGPALIFERYTVTAVERGWVAEMDEVGALVLQRTVPTTARVQPEVVRLELFTHRFETIARDMGEMLRRTALSTNVKERRDFSCAVLDAGGELVANAPHIPVHLGAIGLCVRAVHKELPLGPGDVAVTNHPRCGGSHLPDVTLITPVHLSDGRLLAFVANRAHHAEIGGVRPGSMPPAARTLAEEGVVIPPTYLFKNGEACWEDVRRLLVEASFPSRAVEENLADLNAAVAAARAGTDALVGLATEHGADAVHHYMKALKNRAASCTRSALARIPDGVYEATERLDDGSPLQVRVDIAGDAARIDFAGSAPVHPHNLNMTRAVANSVVVYVLRLLLREPLPLNEGLMQAVELEIPPGLLNPGFPADPSRAPAVAGGNVETSQRLVDTLLRALGLAACSQGTMNNVTFGDNRLSYYETVGGGAGATEHGNGESAVHTHMTNTRITDPELLEHRYPVRLERFAIRRGSGGQGRHNGGEGVIREITFLQPMSLSVLGQHRLEAPYGLEGGEPGATAAQAIVRPNGEFVELGSADEYEVEPGDRFILETPGGGGWGKHSPLAPQIE
jgi:5-oxoprolinase (ATP-hydrolysing)